MVDYVLCLRMPTIATTYTIYNSLSISFLYIFSPIVYFLKLVQKLLTDN